VRTKLEGVLGHYFNPATLDNMQRTTNRNATLFIRDALLYIDLSDAIRSGDIGRIEEALKWITVCVQSASTKNYANELLHLHCGFRYAWTEQAKRAFMSSWLVNTTGKENRWLPADLYQEHCNLLIKVIHAAKGSNSSWEFLAECVSPNIEVFDRVANKIHEEFKLSHNSTRHHKNAATGDINRIIQSLREYKIFELVPGPQLDKEVLPVVDLFKTGTENLQRERITRFREKGSGGSGGNVVNVDDQSNKHPEDQEEQIEANFDRSTYQQYIGDWVPEN
jgi:hypothetical protein